jgi:hypothetical protein
MSFFNDSVCVDSGGVSNPDPEESDEISVISNVIGAGNQRSPKESEVERVIGVASNRPMCPF